MLRTVCPEPTLWDSILPECALGLPPGLAEVDRLLDDPRFFEPFRPFFSATRGRPSVPMECYVRLMFLKYRYRLGFETLCGEVADSLAWRRFCRLPIDARVPHPSTLEKITARCGETAVAALNETLLAKAAEAKLVKVDRLRADTTVVPANVAHPSDAGLLAKGVVRLARLTARLKAMGVARRTRFRDRTRSVSRRSHAIGAWLRRRTETAKDEVMAITAEMVTIAEAALADSAAVIRNARRKLNAAGGEASGQAHAALAELERTAATLAKVVAQTRIRVAGGMPEGSSRVVSYHDPDARPIAKGRIGKPVEFGYKAQVVDNADGLIVDYQVLVGNPSDAPLLAPAIARVKGRFARTPKAVTADRGYGDAPVETDLVALGVKQVVIPRRGRPNAERARLQRSARFTKLVKWRTGSEGRVATLKRNWAWNRTLMDGIGGTTTWCAWGVLAHNATKIATLTASAQPPGAHQTPRRPLLPKTASPPGDPPPNPPVP
jgi:transposase, IS5 family